MSELDDVRDRQLGLFTRTQALEAGFSPYVIRSRLGNGRWVRVMGAVLRQAGTAVTPSVRDYAAFLAAGESATMSGPSAARLHGLDVRSSMTCVTVPPGRHITLPSVRVLRERVAVEDLVLVDDLVVTRPGRTVFDCLRLLPHAEASVLLDRACSASG